MDHAVEAGPQRVRDHLRRTLPGGRDLLMETAGSTVSEIDPLSDGESSVSSAGRPVYGTSEAEP